MDERAFVIVGSGNAGVSAARTLVEHGAHNVQLLTAEPYLPYDRTTLSKPFGADARSAPPLWEAKDAWAEQLTVRLRTSVTHIDREARSVSTSDGDLRYDVLLLAPGATPRTLELAGAQGSDVYYLRDLDDALALRSQLRRGRKLVLIGGGVIGLELAAVAAELGVGVHVVEAGPRLLSRGIPEAVAHFLEGLHREHGVHFHIGVPPRAFLRDDTGALTGVALAGETTLPADLAVIGIGVQPRTLLAQDAGLEVDDGIIVGPDLRTSDPLIFAAGDAVRMRRSPDDAGVRLENWYPAGHQGIVAALGMLGQSAQYDEAPWSWSDQYDAMLQAVGRREPDAEALVFGDGERLLLVIEHVAGLPVSACGVGRGPGIGKPIKAVQRMIEQRVPLDTEALSDCPDLATATQLLVDAAQASNAVA